MPTPPVASSSSSDDGEDDELSKDVSDRWELRKVIETKSNPEGLVFGPSEEGEGAWLAFTTRSVAGLASFYASSLSKGRLTASSL